MAETTIISFILGILGGLIANFFKLWIDDFRSWQRSRLSHDDKLLLQIMLFRQGSTRFKINMGSPPVSEFPGFQTSPFEDSGEVAKLVSIGHIHQTFANINESEYSLSPTGWGIARKLPLWLPTP